MSTIIGYYGCHCHPFETWEECEKETKKKAPNGTVVQDRCKGDKGVVIEQMEQRGYVVVKFGKNRSDEKQRHVANLIITNESVNPKQINQLQLL